MKISKIVIKDIEIILSDEQTHEEQIHEEHEHKCQCSKGEDSLLNSLGSIVEVFSETITDYLKEELSGKKKVKKEEVKKEEVKKNMNDVDEKKFEVQEIPIIKEVKKQEESKPILEKFEPKEVKKEKIEEVEKVSKPEYKENTDGKKAEGQGKNILSSINPSSDLNDFINKILNNMPDK